MAISRRKNARAKPLIYLYPSICFRACDFMLNFRLTYHTFVRRRLLIGIIKVHTRDFSLCSIDINFTAHIAMQSVCDIIEDYCVMSKNNANIVIESIGN